MRRGLPGNHLPDHPGIRDVLRTLQDLPAKGGVTRVNDPSASMGIWGVPIAVIGGAFRVTTPFLFVSLGETLTEKSGRINLGLEGTLIMGAMSGYAISSLSGSPWVGVLVAGFAGAGLGLIHALLCAKPRVNDVAVGIAMM